MLNNVSPKDNKKIFDLVILLSNWSHYWNSWHLFLRSSKLYFPVNQTSKIIFLTLIYVYLHTYPNHIYQKMTNVYDKKLKSEIKFLIDRYLGEKKVEN